MFESIFSEAITLQSFAAALAFSVLAGLLIALIYAQCAESTKSFLLTLVLLPVCVQMVIMLVNGSIGTGIAIAGAFSLIRFRSALGSGQEISAVFIAMTAGLACGIGYVFLSLVFTVFVMLLYFILSKSSFGKPSGKERILKVTVPETLDFEGIFDDIFLKYTKEAELADVRTVSMGSLYRLTYRIRMRNNASCKEMIDRIRERNGNLEIVCTREESAGTVNSL